MSDQFDRGYWGDKIDISRWGSACGRGVAYKDTGAPVASGTKAQVHKISTGRKSRGSSSDDYGKRGAR
jgi:hypothetical protein